MNSLLNARVDALSHRLLPGRGPALVVETWPWLHEGLRTGVASGCRRPPASFAGSRGEVCTAIGADGGIRPLGGRGGEGGGGGGRGREGVHVPGGHHGDYVTPSGITSSANRTVTCLYSADRLTCVTGAPHSLQNLEFSGSSVPHDPHDTPVAVRAPPPSSTSVSFHRGSTMSFIAVP